MVWMIEIVGVGRRCIVTYVQPRIHTGEWDALSTLGFWDTKVLPNLGQTTRSDYSKQKKKRKKERKRKKKKKKKVNLPNCWFCWVQSENITKGKEKEVPRPCLRTKNTMKRDDEIGTDWGSALGTNPKGLAKELENREMRGQVETIQTISSLRPARIRRIIMTDKIHRESHVKMVSGIFNRKAKANGKIQRGTFQADSISLLVFGRWNQRKNWHHTW